MSYSVFLKAPYKITFFLRSYFNQQIVFSKLILILDDLLSGQTSRFWRKAQGANFAYN